METSSSGRRIGWHHVALAIAIVVDLALICVGLQVWYGLRGWSCIWELDIAEASAHSGKPGVVVAIYYLNDFGSDPWNIEVERRSSAGRDTPVILRYEYRLDTEATLRLPVQFEDGAVRARARTARDGRIWRGAVWKWTKWVEVTPEKPCAVFRFRAAFVD